MSYLENIKKVTLTFIAGSALIVLGNVGFATPPNSGFPNSLVAVDDEYCPVHGVQAKTGISGPQTVRNVNQGTDPNAEIRTAVIMPRQHYVSPTSVQNGVRRADDASKTLLGNISKPSNSVNSMPQSYEMILMEQRRLQQKQQQEREERQRFVRQQQTNRDTAITSRDLRSRGVAQNAPMSIPRPWYDPLGVLDPPQASDAVREAQRARAERMQRYFATQNNGTQNGNPNSGVAVPVQNFRSQTANIQRMSPAASQLAYAADAVSVRQPAASPGVVRPIERPEQVRQVTYRTNGDETAKPEAISVAPNNTINTVPGTPSPELLKPWNVEDFARRTPKSSGPYQLVSDTQTVAVSRSAPPAMGMERFAPPPETTTRAQRTNNGSLVEKMPILGLGRDLVKEFRPTNDRKWSQNHAVLQTGEFNGNRVTVRNVRYSKYETDGSYTTRYYDATFNLDEIQHFDLIVVPFRAAPRLAHVEASFGFGDGRHLGLSIEARYEEGEQYDALGAAMRQFELIYVFADERDLIRIGTDVNKNDVHIYRLKLEPSEVREIFVDAIQRANALAAKPEFYHPLSNSCVTNLVKHVNKGRPKAIPSEYRTLLPGLIDSYVYDLKLVETSASNFKEAKENAKVNWLVEKYGDLEYFSAGIRQNMY